MSNCLFAYPDYLIPTEQFGILARPGGYTPLLTGGFWSNLSNIMDPKLDTFTGSFNAQLTSTTFDIDLGVTRELRVFAIPGHNFSSAATVQVKVGTVAGFASGVVADSGATVVYPRYYPTGSIPSTHESYTDGKLTQEALSKLDSLPGWYYVHTAAVNGRYVRVIINDTTNSQGYVIINRFICAPAWQPTSNMSFGVMPTWISNDSEIATLTGVVLFDKRSKKRSFQLVFSSLSMNEAMVYPFEMQRLLGIDGEVFFVYDPADTDGLLRQRSFLGTLKQMSPIEYPYFGTLGAAMELIEKL
jgi:hypothetical protein